MADSPPQAVIKTFNHVLVVDDDEFTRVYVKRILERRGYTIETAMDGQQALDKLEDLQPDLILLDVVMPGMNGFETIAEIRRRPAGRHIPVIFVTAVEDPETIMKVFEHSETDYVGKPIRESELFVRIKFHLELRRQQMENDERLQEIISLRHHLLTGKLDRPAAFSAIVTQDHVMFSLFQYIESIAVTSWPVLITGETGTGKELIARAVHDISGRPGDFIAVNVAGLDDNMFADTLFGHAKGAFTGAEAKRAGLIEQAAKGTLFLDEIGDLEQTSQVKLLRLLQEREYYPLGADVRKVTDARVVVATNRSLEELIRDEQFRQDLYYRLRTHHLHLPPLRERQDDLVLLLDSFIQEAARQLQKEPPDYPDELLELLRSYSFPGNIRELESMVYDAVSRSTSESLDLDLFRQHMGATIQAAKRPPEQADDQPAADGDLLSQDLQIIRDDDFPTIREMNEILIEKALDRTDGNQTNAAKLLGISRQALNKRLKRAED